MNDTSSTPSTTPIPNNYGVATSMADVQNQINEMEAFFETGATLPVDFRLRQLRRLQAYLLAHEQEALMPSRRPGKIRLRVVRHRVGARLRRDSPLPTEAASMGAGRGTCLRHLRTSPPRPRCTPTPSAWPAVLSPWNYPLQLTLIPLVDAIGAATAWP